MKTLYTLIICLVTIVVAEAQELSYGLTARAGIFKTLASKEITNRGIYYSLGPQAALGAWVQLPLSSNNVQITLLQTADQQNAGEVQYIDRDTRTQYATDLNYRTFSLQLTGIYLYAITGKVALGGGAGLKHTFKAKGVIESSSDGKAPESNFSITRYRNNVSLLLPLEAHYKLNNRFTLLAQVQAQLTNRLRDASAGFREHDLSGTVGVNYSL